MGNYPQDGHNRLGKRTGKAILFGGNKKLKIYGTLNCKSGKRQTKENRVFFSTEKEALESNFRPCGNCMNEAYKKW
ncbi:MAG TPA: Ada metal-binding domain-containing protein [Gillisia sp.]|nr:Ada metal-binding domain-containing protein [Gillisia sp.]